MKRILPALLLLAPVVLTGCQTLKAYNPFGEHELPYNSARQEQPLEVPPGMSPPATNEALVIPNAGGAPAAAGVPAAAPGANAAQPVAAAPPATVPVAAAAGTATSFALSDTSDSAFRRVGLALERGEVGQVTGRDDNTFSYQVAVNTIVTQKAEGGFFKRMFHHDRNEAVQGTVTISVVPQGSGSRVQAAGDAGAAARVIAILKQRLQ